MNEPQNVDRRGQTLRRVARLIGLVFRPLVWISNGVDRRLLVRTGRKLRREVMEQFSFLGDGGVLRFVADENEQDPKSDAVSLVFESRGLRFKAEQWRDNFHMEVAPVHRPDDWQDIGSVLRGFDARRLNLPSGRVPGQVLYFSPSDLARILGRRLGDVRESLAEDNYAATKQMIERIKETERQQSIKQINQRVLASK